MEKNILGKNFVDFLISQRENGMGYHLVDVITKDGDIFENVTVLNCDTVVSVEGYDELPFEMEEILEIKVA